MSDKNCTFDVRTWQTKLSCGEGSSYLASFFGDQELEHATHYLHMLLSAVEKDENSQLILADFSRMITIPDEQELDSLLVFAPKA